MALISKVGRKSPKTFGFIVLIYTLLTIGGITMVYPFLMTLTGAISNEFDYYNFNCYPHYWFNGKQRYLKYLAERYDGATRFDFFKRAYRMPDGWSGFRDIGADFESAQKQFPLFGLENDASKWNQAKTIASDYDEFMSTKYNSRRTDENVIPLFLRWNEQNFEQYILNRYLDYAAKKGEKTDNLGRWEKEKIALNLIGKTRGDYYESVEDIGLDMFAKYGYQVPKWIPAPSERHLDFIDWLKKLKPSQKMPVCNSYLWYKFLQGKGLSVEKYNKLPGIAECGLIVENLTQANFPESSTGLPHALKQLRDEYVRSAFPLRLRKLPTDPAAQKAFQKSMAEQFGSVQAFNKLAGTDYSKWADIKLTAMVPCPDDAKSSFKIQYAKYNTLISAWKNYAEKVPGTANMMMTAEKAYQDFYYQNMVPLTKSIKPTVGSLKKLADIDLPIPVSDYVYYVNNASSLATNFVTYNFSRVIGFMLLRGRAFLNTFVLVTLSILATLTINPLAAYSLSRFRLRHTNQILVFLLATMAFPAEVAMIPSFLLLRDFSLLNTYWALILPTVANGFAIFLLKGFFDSLPKELYEAASIDGASEFQMFFNITLSLCKPILAVNALNAFIAAYGSFMWAFLVCQDQSMWTIMVWLFNFQSRMVEYPYMVMASLALASIPTLCVFMFCQKIILRGIIVPSMK